MAYFIDENGTYFEGDIEYERSQGRVCTEVPRKPDCFHDWVDEKWQLTEEGIARKEGERIEEVKAQLSLELPDLIYANKDDPAALSKALTDRAKEIDAETAIKSITQKKGSK